MTFALIHAGLLEIASQTTKLLVAQLWHVAAQSVTLIHIAVRANGTKPASIVHFQFVLRLLLL